MQISTALLLNAQTTATTVDKKVSKEALKQAFLSSTEAPSATPPPTSSNVKEIVANLLGSLVSEAKSKSAILDLLQNAPIFKNLGNFTNDLKSLITFLKSEPNLEKPLLFLQNFEKNIQTVDAKILKEQVQNSGVFLESKLANILSKEVVVSDVKSLVAELKEHLSQTNKSASLTKEMATLMQKLENPKEMLPSELQSTLKSVLDLFRQSVKQHLSFESPPILKDANQMVSKLENSLKQMALITSKIENSPHSVEIEQHFTAQVKELLSTLKQELPKIIPNANEMKPLIVQIETLLSQPSLVMQTAVTQDELSVQDQLTMLTNRIKTQITISDPSAPKQAHYIDNSTQLEQKIVSLLKPEVFISPSVMQKLSLNLTDVEMLSDMKGVLTHLHENLATSTSPKAGEALEATNKLLTQIDYHQLASFVSSSAHLYIPFTWEGLSGGSMQMKQTQEDHFHCQIDLDLEQYGKINMMLLLSQDKYIDITIATQKNELKEKVSEHLSSLKQALNEVGLITGSVKIIEYKETNGAKNDYFADEQLNFGINISI